MIPDEARTALGFTEDWRSLAIVTPERIEEFAIEFQSGDDPNPEHYRWRAFQQFLRSNRPLTHGQAEALYRLGDRDPEVGMGGAMMATILQLPECPPGLYEAALSSGRGHLVKWVRHWRMQRPESY